MNGASWQCGSVTLRVGSAIALGLLFASAAIALGRDGIAAPHIIYCQGCVCHDWPSNGGPPPGVLEHIASDGTRVYRDPTVGTF